MQPGTAQKTAHLGGEGKVAELEKDRVREERERCRDADHIVMTDKSRQDQPMRQSDKATFSIVENAAPKALVIHCADVRFRKAFRDFLEGDAENCLGFTEEQYVSLVIPGGVSSLSEAMALPKQFKATREQIKFLLNRFKTIDQVIVINHEDCSAYKVLWERIGASFLQRFASLLERQKIDLTEVAKTIVGLSEVRATIKLYMAKFANGSNTEVIFEEVELGKR